MHSLICKRWYAPIVALLLSLFVMACSQEESASDAQDTSQANASRYIVSVLDEPETTDFQCTTIDYTVALNCFDRLVETHTKPNGDLKITPSLAKSWEVSDDGRTYTFLLRDDVTFTNGSELTAQDVRYTFERLLTHPNSCNQDIALDIQGAKELAAGKADELVGIRVVDDHTVEITLEQPYAAFLACLCMPSASILDEQSTEAAGERFGKDPEATIGTGPYIFKEWREGEGLLFVTNRDYWDGAPRNDGVDLRFVYEPSELDKMFESGQLDLLNVDDLGDLGDYYLHGDAHSDELHKAPHIGIDYVALNESVKPLDDVRVRKALQLSLDRQALLDAAYAGSGRIENGIYPYGLYGHNRDLETIPYDPEEATRLLEEAKLADGFDLEICMRASAPQWQRQLVDMMCSMWNKVGVRTTVTLLNEDEFMSQRTSGKLPCYMASWAADYDDPDNFVYTFFGNRKNTTFRSLCYANDEAMERVQAARSITNEDERIAEYWDLERIIVQDDAAWIPLFSRERNFLVSSRIQNFTTIWNGWFEASYKYMSIRE